MGKSPIVLLGSWQNGNSCLMRIKKGYKDDDSDFTPQIHDCVDSKNRLSNNSSTNLLNFFQDASKITSTARERETKGKLSPPSKVNPTKHNIWVKWV